MRITETIRQWLGLARDSGQDEVQRRRDEAPAGDPALLCGLAMASIERGETDEAARALRTALALAPGEPLVQTALVRLVEQETKKPSGVIPAAVTSRLEEPGHPLISVVICSIDERKFAQVTANYAERLAGERYEVIGIHDARSLCEGYNRGAAQARGDIVVFSHDDIEILTPDFAARLKRHLAAHDVAGPCGTSRLIAGHWKSAGWPHLHGLVAHHFPEGGPNSGLYHVMVLDSSGDDATGLMQGLDGMFFAANRRVLERCRFDEDTFDGFHLYDLDFTFSAYLAGFDVAVFRDITMIHYTYADTPGYEEEFTRYRLRFEAKYAGELFPGQSGKLRFIPAMFETKEQVGRFCEALLAFRREAAGVAALR